MSERRQEAERLLNGGDAVRAESLLETVVAAQPNDARAWHLLGTARYRNGRLGPAAEAFSRRLQLVADDPVAHYSLGVALRDLGHTDDARRHLQRAVSLKPDFAQARQRLSELSSQSAPPAQSGGGPGQLQYTGPNVGRVRQVRIEKEDDPWTKVPSRLLTFRVERTDAYGNPLSPVSVQMQGTRIRGEISNGDWVRLPARRRPGRAVRTTSIHNLTTGEIVKATSTGRWVMRAIVAAAVAGFVVFVLWGIAQQSDGPSGGEAPSGQAGPQVPPVIPDGDQTPVTDDVTETTVPEEPSEVVPYTVSGLSFEDLTAPPGASIEIENDSDAAHTFTADDGSFDVPLAPGLTATVTAPSDPGKYPFHCEIHDTMSATLTVEG